MYHFSDDEIFHMFMNGHSVKGIVKIVSDSENITRRDARSKVECTLYFRMKTYFSGVK